MKLAKWIGAVSLVASLTMPWVSLAQSDPTVAQLQQQIQALMAQLQSLKQQIPQGQSSQPVPWCHSFTTNLEVGSTGPEVQALQQALSKDGESISVSGTFDEKTTSAVTGFQEKYASQVLAPSGLRNGTGYAGRATRSKLNSLFGCGSTTPTTMTPPVACPMIMPYCPNGSRTVLESDGCQQTICNSAPTPTPVSPVITVQILGSGTSFMQGSPLSITWNWTGSSSDPSSISISLLQNGVPVAAIGSGTPYISRYTWIVPNVYSGNGFAIAISAPGFASGTTGIFSITAVSSSQGFLMLSVPTDSSIFMQAVSSSNIISWNGGQCAAGSPNNNCVGLGLDDTSGNFKGWVMVGLPTSGSYQWDAKTICAGFVNGVGIDCTSIMPGRYKMWVTDSAGDTTTSPAFAIAFY